MNRATSLLTSTGFQEISHLVVEFDSDESYEDPVECVADFLRNCPKLKTVTVKNCAQSCEEFFANPVIRSNSRSIRFEVANYY